MDRPSAAPLTAWLPPSTDEHHRTLAALAAGLQRRVVDAGCDGAPMSIRPVPAGLMSPGAELPIRQGSDQPPPDVEDPKSRLLTAREIERNHRVVPEGIRRSRLQANQA